MSFESGRALDDAGQAGAATALRFDAHGRMVYALCRLLLQDQEEAEDAAQQSFLSAHRSLLKGVRGEQPPAWLATIARNECKRRLSRRPPAPASLDGAAEPVAPADTVAIVQQRSEIAALSAALADLPPSQREAVILREFYGLSYREVAAALGLSGPAVESVLFKSRKKLQEKLGPIRAASSALSLPVAIQQALATAIPGFGASSAAGAGAAAGGAFAKLGGPTIAKLTAVVATLAAGGTLATTALHDHGVRPAPAPPPALSATPGSDTALDPARRRNARKHKRAAAAKLERRSATGRLRPLGTGRANRRRRRRGRR